MAIDWNSANSTMPEIDWLASVCLFFVGIASSIINIVAGGGSFLNLPLLMLFGLSPGVANATNRVGVLAGLVTGTYKFYRSGQLKVSDLWLYCLPAALGGILGAQVALHTDDGSFRIILACLMFVGSWTVISRPHVADTNVEPNPKPLLAWILFICVGIYGGFIQAGNGFFALAAAGILGLGLKRGNAMKTLMNLCLTLPALFVFLKNGLVDWPSGLALATGMALGGNLGVRIAEKSDTAALKKMVAAAILLSAGFVLYPLLSS